ncbi:MAG: hypothetical protein H6702_15150 [Myxococcales bacterium]|nr:hypothetical protein [Myxococcales bacterium]
MSEPAPAPEPSTRARLRRVLVIVAVAQALALAVGVGWLLSRTAAPPPSQFDDLMAAAREDAAQALDALGPAVLAAAPAACGVEPPEAHARLARVLAEAAARGCRATAAHLEGQAGHFEVTCAGDLHLAVPIHVGPDGKLSFMPTRRCPAFMPDVVSTKTP